jgi:hypothetical protein
VLLGVPTALDRRRDLAGENPGSFREASGKVRRRGSHHSELALVRWKKARRQCYGDRRQRSSDRRRPPGGSAAWGGEGEGEVQLDWRREVHRGELTEAVATVALAASKPVTPTCLRRPVQTRCKGGGARWRSCAVRLGKKWCEEERGRWRALHPF